MKERLQKILSHAGVASRRKAEEMILAGRIKVNGKIVRELGTEADIRKDRIEADGKPVRPERLRYFLFFKPDRSSLPSAIRRGGAPYWIFSRR